MKQSNPDMERSELRQFVTSMEPPHHLLEGDDWKERRKSRRKVLKETWQEITAPLQEDRSVDTLRAYQALLKKKDRLEHHLEELQAERDKYQNQTKYFQALISLWQEKMGERGLEPDDRISAGLPEKLKGNSSSAQKRAEKETDDPRFGGNRPHPDGPNFTWLEEYSANSTASRARWKLCLNPDEETLEKSGVDKEALLQPHSLTFKGQKTWREGGKDLERRRQEDSARYHKLAQTVELVTFRLSVLRNVLYQYEVFDSVWEMTPEETENVLEQQLEELEVKYQDAQKELSNAHRKIKALKRWGAQPSKDELKSIIDENRFRTSGKVNFAAIARVLKCSSKTAKSRIKEMGLLDYAMER